MASQYRRVAGTWWSRAGFNAVSKMPPSAQGLALYLLTTGETGYMAGVHRIGVLGLAEALEWEPDDVDRCLAELEAVGVVKADRAKRIVWVPSVIEDNTPDNANQCSGWASEWERLPECPLLEEIRQVFRETIARRRNCPKTLEAFDLLSARETLAATPLETPPETPPATPPATLAEPHVTRDTRQAARDTSQSLTLSARVCAPLVEVMADDPPPDAGRWRWALAETLLAEHPSHRRSPPADVVNALAAVDQADAETLTANHALWAKSREWREERGRYAPRLAKFLTDQTWRGPPPSAASDTDEVKAERLATIEASMEHGRKRRAREAEIRRQLGRVA